MRSSSGGVWLCGVLLWVLAVSWCDDCMAYAVMSSTEGNNSNELYNNEDADADDAPTENHITQLVAPGDIVLPTMDQLKLFVDASLNKDQLASNERHNEAMRLSSQERREIEEEQLKVLTYREIYLMLALWRAEQERHAYSVSNGSGDATQ